MVDNRDISEFNDAIGYLNRMNKLFYTIDTAKIMLDSFTWGNTLIALYAELIPDIKDTNKLDEEAKEILGIINSEKFRSKKISSMLYWKMFEFEKPVRILYDKQGYRTKKTRDPTMSMM